MCRDGFASIGAVQAHIDHCNGEPASKKQRARSTQTSLPPQPVSKAKTKRPERLAQLNYSMVKDNALRKKLGDLAISQAGSRPLMERRYTEWVTLWNSNCDSKNPKGKAELKRELDVWERTQGGGSVMSSRVNPAGNIRDKDFDGSAWSKNNDDSFRDLIAQARKKRAVEAEEPSKAETVGLLPGAVHQLPHASQSASPVDHSQQQPPYESHMPVSETENKTPLNHHVPELKSETISASLLTTRSSERRFVEDAPPSSSQVRSTQVLEKDNGIDSDIAALRPLQS